MELYLITGFLGAGKTTFIKNVIKSLQNKKIYLIINEFGKQGVDGALLRQLDATLAEINNGSIFCTCRLDKFEETLVAAIGENPEIILVESSGLSDPTNVRKILSQSKYTQIDYRGCVCLVDAKRFVKVYDTARVVRRQLAISSLILINKTDIASQEQTEYAIKTIKEINPHAKISLTTFAQIEPDVFSGLEQIDYGFETGNERDITLQKYLITIKGTMKVKQLESFLNMIAEETYRMKGFVYLEEIMYYVDCVGPMVDICPHESDSVNQVNQIVVLAGKGMNTRKSIKEARQWYTDFIEAVE